MLPIYNKITPLIGQIDESVRKIVSEQNKGTATPDEALVHEGSY